MKIKRILPIFLLLSLCVGLLTGCDIVSADELPTVTQEQAPAAEEKPADDGIFTITDDEGIGELYAKVLRGEMVFECFSEWDDLPSERSGLYVSEYVLNVMQQLNTLEVEPISFEQLYEALRPGTGINKSASINGCTIDKKITLGLSVYETGYIAVAIGGLKMSGGEGFFKTKQNLEELRKQIDSFWGEEANNSFHGIGDNGKVGSEWRKYMAEGAIDVPHLWGKKIFGMDNTTNQHISLEEGGAVEQKKALIEVLRTLDDYVVKELSDVICECDQCIEIKQEITGPLVINLNTSLGRRYDGFKLLIYSDAIELHSFETREVAYFRLQEGAGETIRSLIMEAVT